MKILAVLKKELQTYFFSPVAYIVFAAFLLVVGYLFSMVLINSRLATLEPMLGNAGFILMLISPILTMRLISEERRSNTIELLLTSPISPVEVVIGKFLACLVLYIVLIFLTLQFPLIVFKHSTGFDLGPVYSGYVGLILLSAAYISVGLFASTLAENQIISAIVSFGITLLFWVIGWVKYALEGNPLGDVFYQMSLLTRYQDFLKGLVDSSNIVYFLVFTLVWLFLATRVLESERWR